ncbi:MAG: hypothetical protein JNL96_02525 [Planctomycetaceae bacterium]|nr:hypothetical protein [Planctomycetaceae bacterium]
MLQARLQAGLLPEAEMLQAVVLPAEVQEELLLERPLQPLQAEVQAQLLQAGLRTDLLREARLQAGLLRKEVLPAEVQEELLLEGSLQPLQEELLQAFVLRKELLRSDLRRR